MSKTTKSTSNTRTSHNYDGLSDEASHTSSNEEEVSLPRPVKSKKSTQPLDVSDYDDNLYDRQGRSNRRRRSGIKSKRRLRGRQSRSRSRRRR